MYKKINSLFVCSVLLLSGCAGVKSSFDCDATTSDTCMTMTKANQMARDKAARQAGKQAAGGLPSLVNLPAASVPAVPAASRSIINLPPMPRSGAINLAPRPVAGTPVTTAIRPQASPRPDISAAIPAPSCQNVRCDNPGSVRPSRRQDQTATVWIAPWVDSDNAFHQPGRVSFVVRPADWVLPSRVNCVFR